MSTVYLDQTMVSIDNIQNIQKILTIVSSSIFEPDFVPPSNSVQFLRNCSSPKLYTRDYWTENPGNRNNPETTWIIVDDIEVLSREL